MIDLIKNLDDIARLVASPFETSLDDRREALRSYPGLLTELHLYRSEAIDATLKQYNRHIDQFLTSVESYHEGQSLKAFLLIFPIEEGLRNIAKSAFLQRNAENTELESIRDRLRLNFILAATADDRAEPITNSIVHHTQNRIDFVPTLERLCRIAESEKQPVPVRNLAILVMGTIYAEAVQSFNLVYKREKLEQRLLDVGINSKDLSLTKHAIEFVDGINPAARAPSQP